MKCGPLCYLCLEEAGRRPATFGKPGLSLGVALRHLVNPDPLPPGQSLSGCASSDEVGEGGPPGRAVRGVGTDRDSPILVVF